MWGMAVDDEKETDIYDLWGVRMVGLFGIGGFAADCAQALSLFVPSPMVRLCC